MRNITEYPITQAEAEAALKWAITERIKTGNFGDIYPAALREVLSLVEKAWVD